MPSAPPTISLSKISDRKVATPSSPIRRKARSLTPLPLFTTSPILGKRTRSCSPATNNGNRNGKVVIDLTEDTPSPSPEPERPTKRPHRGIKYTPSEREKRALQAVAAMIHTRLRKHAEKSGCRLQNKEEEFVDVDIDISIRHGSMNDSVHIQPRYFLGSDVGEYWGEEEPSSNEENDGEDEHDDDDDDEDELFMREPWREKDGRLNTLDLLHPDKKKM